MGQGSKVDIEGQGQGHQVKNVIQVSFDHLTGNVRGQGSLVRVKGHVGQGHRSNELNLSQRS